ncbi:MAG: hypothetical protein Q4C95_08090 [Planctomycetia bacterium]|nr:hypothetical protein [Planctomycetia bacterium]
MKRRDFIKTAGGATVVSTFLQNDLLNGTIAFSQERDSGGQGVRFIEPFDGAILHRRSGEPVLGLTETGTLKIKVSGTTDRPVELMIFFHEGIHGEGQLVPIHQTGNEFRAEVELRERFNTLQLFDAKTKNAIDGATSLVIWLKESFPRYRFQIDDNSFWLRDIHQQNYQSLFDCFYLAMLRDFHKKYNSKFALNCFYSTPERDFDMSMFSDRYKSEFEDNADWLRLTFHAENEFPDNPYQNATPEKLAADFDQTAAEIQRFAGMAYSAPAIIHWGTIRPECYQTLYDRGVRSLSGYFIPLENGQWLVNFQLPDAQSRYLMNHDAWFDKKSRLIFSKLSIVCNTVSLAETIPTIQRSMANPNTAEVMDLLTHEQYFWPFYQNYYADHADRLDAVLRYVTEFGYKPVWHNDGFYSV